MEEADHIKRQIGNVVLNIAARLRHTGVPAPPDSCDDAKHVHDRASSCPISSWPLASSKYFSTRHRTPVANAIVSNGTSSR